MYVLLLQLLIFVDVRRLEKEKWRQVLVPGVIYRVTSYSWPCVYTNWLVKCVCVNSGVYSTSQFLQGNRKTRLCLSGRVVWCNLDRLTALVEGCKHLHISGYRGRGHASPCPPPTTTLFFKFLHCPNSFDHFMSPPLPPTLEILGIRPCTFPTE